MPTRNEIQSDANLLPLLAKAARRYCTWAKEGSHLKGYKAFMKAGQRATAEVYLLTSMLPEAAGITGMEDLAEDVYGAVEHPDPAEAKQIERFLGSLDQESYEDFGYMGMALAEMAEGLTKAYFGLKLGLDYFERGEEDKARFVWQYGYAQEWGYPLVEALAVIHSILYIP